MTTHEMIVFIFAGWGSRNACEQRDHGPALTQQA